MKKQIEAAMIEAGISPFMDFVIGAEKAIEKVKAWGFEAWKESTTFSPAMQQIIFNLSK